MRKIYKAKEIKCKVCSKEFRVTPSRLATKKYCSKECATKDNWGFKPKKKQCVICGADFTITSGLQTRKKTCSDECRYALMREITKRNEVKRKKKPVERTCKNCAKKFTGNNLYKNHYCSFSCQYDSHSKNCKGKKNANYRNGLHTDTSRGRGHRTACRNYRKKFIEKHGYVFCEVCKVNSNGTAKHEVHHIYFASLYPQHPELHNDKNLILVCIECHNKFHAGKQYEQVFKKIEKERGLKKLFNL